MMLWDYLFGSYRWVFCVCVCVCVPSNHPHLIVPGYSLTNLLLFESIKELTIPMTASIQSHSWIQKLTSLLILWKKKGLLRKCTLADVTVIL
jgi:hypothetical protein